MPARAEPERTVLGDPCPRGLLVAVRGEVHQLGVGAELRACPAAQRGLGEGRGDQLGRVVPTQPAPELERVRLGVVRVGPREKLLPGRGAQLGERVEIHPAKLSRAHWDEAGNHDPTPRSGHLWVDQVRDSLALGLTEC